MTAWFGGDRASREGLSREGRSRADWLRWGPYLSQRAWGTVREDYSADGDAWAFFPHDQARSRAYRWGEDGLLGWCDDRQLLCLAPALWNGHDPILKERLFGLSGPEGNHGEDIKELWVPLDAAPDYSYAAARYRYPNAAFPYLDLVETNASRGRDLTEYELGDTGVFDADAFTDLVVEYAKSSPDEVIVAYTLTNWSADAVAIDLLATLWFRNTWSWEPGAIRPTLTMGLTEPGTSHVLGSHHALGAVTFAAYGDARLVFTENETNTQRLWGRPGEPFSKDAFHRLVIDGAEGAVNPDQHGSKAAGWWHVALAPGESSQRVVRLQVGAEAGPDRSLAECLAVVDDCRARLGAWFSARHAAVPAPQREVLRAALAGAMWSRQSYRYDVSRWLAGDPGAPVPFGRSVGRNHDWAHVDLDAVMAMPDPWEYPWFAAWDSGFQAVTAALLDPEFAKEQVLLLLGNTAQHPNGQLPAYEWDFGDGNPPVIAWSAWRIAQLDARGTGTLDRAFLERVFHKLLLTFTWWVNRRDSDGRNVFQGGFLGLDNIGVFDRSRPIPGGGLLEQTDATAWMGFFSLAMMRIALELASANETYEDLAVTFFEHFLSIAGAIHDIAGEGISLWDEETGFFTDLIRHPDGSHVRVAVRSLVGLIPLLAVDSLEPEVVASLPRFAAAKDDFLARHPDLAALVPESDRDGQGGRRLLTLAPRHRLEPLLRAVLSQDEFLSDHGIRSLSRRHAADPFVMELGGERHVVGYEPGDSQSALFGGNSNWRGPVWMPINYLLIHALERYDTYYGDELTVELPTGSGQLRTLGDVAHEMRDRLAGLFLPGPDGIPPAVVRELPTAGGDPWAGWHLFHEYFHGDTGAGMGASHQTGWTALIANLIVERFPTAEHPQGPVPKGEDPVSERGGP